MRQRIIDGLLLMAAIAIAATVATTLIKSCTRGEYQLNVSKDDGLEIVVPK